MQVTSDTLFHFTTSIKNLESILEHKFRLTYCNEKYVLDYQTHDSYYAMISFCDIPVSLIKKQIEKYGSYAIGMTKEWAVKKNLNPIVYMEKNSLLAKDIQSTLDNTGKVVDTLSAQFHKYNKSKWEIVINSMNTAKSLIDEGGVQNLKLSKDELEKSIETLTESQSTISDYKKLIDKLRETVLSNASIFHYIKNYEGVLSRGDKINNSYRFYDEREWRYVPSLNDSRVKQSLTKEEFKSFRGTSKVKPFIEDIILPFESKDIKYLIVKSNKDIPRLIKTIKSLDNFTKNPNDADVLTTRILTVEQLDNDF